MGYTLILTLAMTLGGGGHGGASCSSCDACKSCGGKDACSTCNSCQKCSSCKSCDKCDKCGGCQECGGCCCSPWNLLGLPDPCHPPGNMNQHLPYWADPKFYYYFRPYSFRHIPVQQMEALDWGASPGMPYSNKMFQQVYADLPPEQPIEFVPYDSEDEPAAPMPPATTPPAPLPTPNP